MRNLVITIGCAFYLFSGAVMSQNKVVVIPLGGDGEPVAGLEYDDFPRSTSVSGLLTCASRTILKQVTVTVPKTKSGSYVVCRASGRTLHGQTGKWVFYSLDDALGTGFDVFAYTGVASSVAAYNNYDGYNMQHVYPMPANGGTDTFYLKACREDDSTTGTAYLDDLICEVFTTRY